MSAKAKFPKGKKFDSNPRESMGLHRSHEFHGQLTGETNGSLKDDPMVAVYLEMIDGLERKSRPSIGIDARGKDLAAFDALVYASMLVDHVAGWAVDHQIGMAQKGLSSLTSVPNRIKTSAAYLERCAAVDVHDHELIGGHREPLDPVEARRFVFNLLLPMAGHLFIPHEMLEAIEALDYGETLPILQKARTARRTGLIEYRAKLRAIAFISYENKKGTLKRLSTEVVTEAFGVARDAVKDWRAELRVALGTFEVDRVLEGARGAGQAYVDSGKHGGDEWGPGIRDRFDDQYGKPALLRAAKRYRARSKKGF